MGEDQNAGNLPPVHPYRDNNSAQDYLLFVSKLHRTLTKKPQHLLCQHQTPPVNFPITLLLFPRQFLSTNKVQV